MARGQISWSPDRTDSEAAGHAPITAERPRPHGTPARLDERARGHRVEIAQRRHGKTQSGRGPAFENPVDDDRKRRCGRGIDRLVERRHRQRLPQQQDEPRRLAERLQPLPHGLVRARRASEAHAEGGEAIAPAQRRPSQQSGEQVQRRRQRRADEAGAPPVGFDDLELERGCIRRPSIAPTRPRNSNVS
jgi:hypothetical protein